MSAAAASAAHQIETFKPQKYEVLGCLQLEFLLGTFQEISWTDLVEVNYKQTSGLYTCYHVHCGTVLSNSQSEIFDFAC